MSCVCQMSKNWEVLTHEQNWESFDKILTNGCETGEGVERGGDFASPAGATSVRYSRAAAPSTCSRDACRMVSHQSAHRPPPHRRLPLPRS